MKTEQLQNIFFLTLLTASVALLLALAYPFMGALVVSLTLAIAFRSPFRKLVKKFKGKRGLAAIATIVIIIILVVIPLSLIGTKVFKEISILYQNYAIGGSQSSFLGQITGSDSRLAKYFPGVNFDLQSYIGRGIEWLFTNLNEIFSSAIKIVFNLFIIFTTLFYLFRDGSKLRRSIIKFSPLTDNETDSVISQLELTINAVVKGTVIIAIIQGLLAGIGFSLFGISEPVLWGILATVASLLPGLGTGLIFLPMVIYLSVTGSYSSSIGLALWGILVVGLVDNFLRPFLLERDIKIHPLFIFLSVLGGLSLFGTLGFILGPLILSTAFSLTHIYQNKKLND